MERDPVTFGGHNLAFAEEIYRRFLDDPASVGADWRSLFETFEPERARSSAPAGGHNGGARNVAIASAASLQPASAPSPPAPSQTSRPPRPFGSSPTNGKILDRLPFLESLSIFRGIPPDQIALVAAIADELQVADGEVLFRQGDTSRDMYLVLEGLVWIERNKRMVAALGRGEILGELAMLDHQPRSATAIAQGPARLLRIRGDDLLALLDAHPALSKSLLLGMTRRLRETSIRQDQVDQLIRAYRVRGHLQADLNPLEPPSRSHPELDPAYYGFKPDELDAVFSSATIPGPPVRTLREILEVLRNTYCRSIGAQFMHIDDPQVKDWLQERMESTQNRRGMSRTEQLRILTKLTDAEIFEHFVQSKFVGAKRFSLEGAETLIPLLDLAIEKAAEKQIKELVIGMAHRGRLNVLVNILGKSAQQVFREFDDAYRESNRGAGDVKYHLGQSFDRTTESGNSIHLSLAFNPSHLEFVSSVVIGRVRAKQDRFRDDERQKGMAILIHGDAAMPGQGVIQEILNMSELAGYSTGGSLHIVLNNQIGFTTNPDDSRSTLYATDVARMLQIPIFHVNGEHPEPVAQVIELAMDFREKFKRDVVVDMYCYRRLGHNEGDEPAFTQPKLYELIRRRKPVREGYLDSLFTLGEITREEADQIAVRQRMALEEDLGKARSPAYQTQDLSSGQGVWKPYRGGLDRDTPEVATGVAKEALSKLLSSQAKVPDDFHPHPKIARLLKTREAMSKGAQPLDWAAGEALAFASLLAEGAPVRFSGQDSQRGTFSHRHAILHDVQTDRTYAPLANLSPDQGRFEICNSPLTEIGVLGFDYGYSLDYPEALTIWEAQFGDFVNVAQVIVDQFICSAEDKWRRLSGLTLMLPHGYEGQGPEHSSARIERFLSLAAEDNIQVVNLTTPAQLFHCLRRQVRRPIRKPLVIMTPKSLLRHPEAVSSLDDLAEGGFQRIIDDSSIADPGAVRRVLLTSGKLYYELLASKRERGASDVAIVRLEQYYPLDTSRLEAVLTRYPAHDALFWVQEEPLNMGAWNFLRQTLGEAPFGGRPLGCVARQPSASPATGSLAAHKKEQAELWEAAFTARMKQSS